MLVQDWFLHIALTVWLLQAEDANAISDRWSVIFNNISVVIPQNSDCSSSHVRSLAEFLLCTVVDCCCRQHRYFTFSVCTVCPVCKFINMLLCITGVQLNITHSLTTNFMAYIMLSG